MCKQRGRQQRGAVSLQMGQYHQASSECPHISCGNKEVKSMTAKWPFWKAFQETPPAAASSVERPHWVVAPVTCSPTCMHQPGIAALYLHCTRHPSRLRAAVTYHITRRVTDWGVSSVGLSWNAHVSPTCPRPHLGCWALGLPLMVVEAFQENKNRSGKAS